MNIQRLFVISLVSFLAGCVSSVGVQDAGTISEFSSAVRQTTNAVNNTAPAFNNMNVCPPGMVRVNHTAGGGGDANTHTDEGGTTFNVDADFGQGQQCAYPGQEP